MLVNHYTNKPHGLNDFTTMWLHELLINAVFESAFLDDFKIIDYVATPINE